MMAFGEIKMCSKCQTVKKVHEFTKDSKAKDGLDSWCRSCKRAYNSSPAAKAAAQKWYYKGGGKVRKADYQRGVRLPRREAEPYRFQVLRRKYGLSPQDYTKLLEAQGGKCAICGRADPGRGKEWPVDHDHNTGAVRGLLCWKCNSALGMLRDSPELCEAAARYLRRGGHLAAAELGREMAAAEKEGV